MLRTLYGRLVAALLALLALVSIVYIGAILFTTRSYFQEVSQELNRDLAAHLVDEKLMLDGRVNEAALEESFHWLMVINPSIEIYLLDPDGEILAYSAAPEKVRRSHVSLAPIRRFLSGTDRLPILGDDPRDPEGRKVFSAAPVRSGERIDGYLYVVLGGEEYDSAARMVRGSYVVRLGIGALGASVVVALGAGLLLFSLMTRRLRRLSVAMDRFARSDFRETIDLPGGFNPDSTEEIDRLGSTFDRMARRMVEQVEDLEHADQLRRELVANVSHDLRTPLATLQGYLETLALKAERLSREDRQRYLEVALQHSSRLGRLVGELFELAKLDARETGIHRERFALGELIQDVVQKFQLAASERQIRLETRTLKDLPFVSADIGLIERVLENLIDNALRHTPEGGEVEVVPEADGGRIRVRVSDTGSGISEADLPHVFERFYRGRDAQRRGGPGGGGLGLAIAKRILDLHDTQIVVSNSASGGATFEFELPTAEG